MAEMTYKPLFLPKFMTDSKIPTLKQHSNLVVFVVYSDFKLLDLAGPLQAFNDALDSAGNPAYETAITSKDGGLIGSDTLVSVSTKPIHNFENSNIGSMIVIGGGGARTACADRDLIAAVRNIAGRSGRVGAVCNGAFILAASGLLEDRRAVTHWQSCDDLAAFYPNIDVVPDPIYVKDETIWTSAGVTAGLDMSLAMISEDLGKTAALALARSLVAYMVRPGGQSQFSEVLKLQTADGEGRFDKLNQWIRNNLDKDLRVAVLAGQAHMSPRNFARAYVHETKRTPARAVEALRIEAACHELQKDHLSIKTIAKRCGFGSEEILRRSFLRHLKISPSDYAKRFCGH